MAHKFCPTRSFFKRKKRWKAESDSFPTLFFVRKIAPWSKSDESILPTGFSGWKFTPFRILPKTPALKSVRYIIFFSCHVFSYYLKWRVENLAAVLFLISKKNELYILYDDPPYKTFIWSVLLRPSVADYYNFSNLKKPRKTKKNQEKPRKTKKNPPTRIWVEITYPIYHVHGGSMRLKTPFSDVIWRV